MCTLNVRHIPNYMVEGYCGLWFHLCVQLQFPACIIIIPSCLSPCARCQLLKALTPEENTHCQHGLYFEDGQRRVDYVLTYPVKKPSGGRSSRQSAHLLLENAVAHSLRHGPRSPNKHLRHHQVQRAGDSSSLPSSPVANVELGCPGETFGGHEDHKTFRREEFEGKLRDMGLELEKDEDVSANLY